MESIEDQIQRKVVELRQGRPHRFVGPLRSATYTAEERDYIRACGHDPDVLAATRGARNLTEYKRLKYGGALGLASVTPENKYAREISDWTATLGRFQRRLGANRIPADEIDAAMPTGSPAWHRLIEKWGALAAPDGGKPRGYQFPTGGAA
jgi:hypothetical protein